MINDISPRGQQDAQTHTQTPSKPLVIHSGTSGHSPSGAGSGPGKKNKKFEGWRSVLTTVAILLIAPLFALFLTSYVFQTYQVDGPSMETTLQPNDRLIVWKVPRTWSRLTGNTYIPARGDIVVFAEPRLDEFGRSPTKQLIKRVIALPGERVAIDNGTLTVFNKEHPSGFQPDRDYLEESVVDNTIEDIDVTVPQDHIFVAGDNRNNSLDSRSFGPVHVDNVVGKLAVRILPLGNFKLF